MAILGRGGVDCGYGCLATWPLLVKTDKDERQRNARCLKCEAEEGMD
jgi:hypothetical protein